MYGEKKGEVVWEIGVGQRVKWRLGGGLREGCLGLGDHGHGLDRAMVVCGVGSAGRLHFVRERC